MMSNRRVNPFLGGPALAMLERALKESQGKGNAASGAGAATAGIEDIPGWGHPLGASGQIPQNLPGVQGLSMPQGGMPGAGDFPLPESANAPIPNPGAMPLSSSLPGSVPMDFNATGGQLALMQNPQYLEWLKGLGGAGGLGGV
jgi:hypothetical protein